MANTVRFEGYDINPGTAYADLMLMDGTNIERNCAVAKSNAIFYGLIATPLTIIFGLAAPIIVWIAVFLYRRNVQRDCDERVRKREAYRRYLASRGTNVRHYDMWYVS